MILMRQLAMKYIGNPIDIPVNETYKIRTYVPADYDNMIEALIPLTVKRYEEEDLNNVILKKPGVRADSVFVVDDGTKLIGTATGYTHVPRENNPGDNGGTLHMVSALPEASGRGVGYAVCATVVNYLLNAGCEYVDLTTDDFRLPAIVTYTRLGFRPIIDDEEMQTRWSDLAAKLSLPVLLEEAYR